MGLMPELCTVPSAARPLNPAPRAVRVRALDVGAGVGRVTSDTLLPLVDDVVLVEPVPPLVAEAYARAQRAADGKHVGPGWRGIKDKTKSVTVLRGTLQGLDPARPVATAGENLGTAGWDGASPKDVDSGFDVVWCQWCLGHLSDEDLVAFFQRAAKSLRTRDETAGESKSLIVVKENLCSDGPNGEARVSFDEEDSSLTRLAFTDIGSWPRALMSLARSDQAWKALFRSAGLKLIQERTQLGFPDGLYEVKMCVPLSHDVHVQLQMCFDRYALRPV